MKLRINAGDRNATIAQDNAIAKAYGDKFITPLNFEMLDGAMPYYQAGLRNRLCYEIRFSEYGKLLMHQSKYHPQMLRIRLQISP